MNILKNIGIFAFLVLAMVSCIDKEPSYGNFPTKDVDFTYNIDGDLYKLDFYVVSTIQFNNTSVKKGAVAWDFGDGQTSTENDPKHKYAKSGLYEVTLTVEGAGTRKYPVLIYDIATVLTVKSQSQEVLVINDVDVDLDIFLPNPENLKTKFEWTFPEGTKKEDGSIIENFTGYFHEDGTIDFPGKLTFKNIGSQKIEIKTWFDVEGENRRLEDAYLNIQVGCNHECKTIYYAEYGGNIKAYKLADESKLPEGTKNLPFDLGVKSGSTPQQIIFKKVVSGDGEQDFVYILDCGKQYTYLNDDTSNGGDGKITVMTADGKSADVMVTNVGQFAYDDPFQGCTDDEYLYYTDRGTSVRRLKLTARGEKEILTSETSPNSFVQNAWLAYYNSGISYGAIHTGILLDSKKVFWWTKSYSGNGVYRFRETDIKKGGTHPFPIVLSGINPKAFDIDETRKAMYVWVTKGNKGPGFYVYDLPGDTEGKKFDEFTNYISMEAEPNNNTTDEGLFVSQFAIDKSTGNVYFGFRKLSNDKSKYATGLLYYSPASKNIIEIPTVKDKILGIAINERPTKLF